MPADVAGLAQLLDSQLASLEAEAAAVATAQPAATRPLPAAPAAAPDCSLSAACDGSAQRATQQALLPAARSMRSTLQVLAAILAVAPAAPAPAPLAEACQTDGGHQGAGSRMQDAACGPNRGAVRDSASGEAGNDTASQTEAALRKSGTAAQPAAAAAVVGGFGQQQAPDAAEAATRRADKWKARCSELRRALAASREAAALCSSLKAPQIDALCIPCPI